MTKVLLYGVGAARTVAFVVCLAVFGVSANSVAAPVGPFAEFPGAWSGDGTITLAGGDKERLRCRAAYRVDSANAMNLVLSLGCASDNYKFDFTGEARADDQGSITGRWTETSRSVGGGIVGRARADRIQVLIESSAFSADLLMMTRAGRQSVTIQLRSAGETSSASMTLRRQPR